MILAIRKSVKSMKDLPECGYINALLMQVNWFLLHFPVPITLEDLSAKFYLSKPYLSKYIKESTGDTFGDIVKEIRINKAKALLKNKGMTVDAIAKTVGYQNVEHFN